MCRKALPLHGKPFSHVRKKHTKFANFTRLYFLQFAIYMHFATKLYNFTSLRMVFSDFKNSCRNGVGYKLGIFVVLSKHSDTNRAAVSFKGCFDDKLKRIYYVGMHDIHITLS